MKKKDLKILIVDDEANLREVIALIMTSEGFPRSTSVASGKAALDLLEKELFDLVVTDYEMPGIKGDRVVGAALAANPDGAVIVISGSLSREIEETLLRQGARKCHRKPFKVPRFAGDVELVYRDLIADLESRADMSSLRDMAASCWRENGYSVETMAETLEMALNIGRRVGFCLKELWLLEVAFLVHDLGMARVNTDILRKQSTLDEVEFRHLCKHVEYSWEMVSQKVREPKIQEIVLQHHERADGKGYPGGIRGDAISLQARIIALLDSFRSMSSNRPHRSAMRKEEVISELRRQQDTRWDSRLVNLLVEQLQEKP